jgi:hypothetical protein
LVSASDSVSASDVEAALSEALNIKAEG